MTHPLQKQRMQPGPVAATAEPEQAEHSIHSQQPGGYGGYSLTATD